RCPGARDQDRRRRLCAYSRNDRTPLQLVLELNADGTDYTTHGDFLENDFTVNWQQLRMVLEDADDKRTRRQLLEDWPPDYAAPCDTTLYNWLLHAVELGLVRQEGTGRKTDPFRYWLPDKDVAWNADTVHEIIA